MTRIKHLSYSGLSCFYTSPESFYKRYILEMPRERQNSVMAVGSAFDAYVKSYLSKVFGTCTHALKFTDLFEKSVEPQNRDAAFQQGASCFEAYEKSGALQALINDLDKSSEIVFDKEITICWPDKFDLCITGFLDLYSITRDNHTLILDWKVNGFLSSKKPDAGYMRCYGMNGERKVHKDALISFTPGNIPINLSQSLTRDWRRQLDTYVLLLLFNNNTILAIDQLCCSNGRVDNVAVFREYANEETVTLLLKQYSDVWEIANSDHFFRDISQEESLEKEAALKRVFSGESTDPRSIWIRENL